MSNLWPHFTKENPCPACGKGGDWCCRAGDKKYICMRVSSDHPSKDGGFYHEYGEKKPVYIPPKRSVAKVVNFQFLQNQFVFHKDSRANKVFADNLGVSTESIKSLCVGYSELNDSNTVPMRDGENNIIGIHLRNPMGAKAAIVGSRNGLFLPQGIEIQKQVFIAEGASNTAALLTMGFYALGRPSCNSGEEMLKVALKRLGVSRIVIVADNDPIKNGRRAGQEGAKKLKKELGLMSVLFSPPSPLKDVRDLLNKLGVESARNYINNSVSQKVWTRV